MIDNSEDNEEHQFSAVDVCWWKTDLLQYHGRGKQNDLRLGVLPLMRDDFLSVCNLRVADLF